MTGAEFIRRVRRLGRGRGVAVRFTARRGKGSHGTIFFGTWSTVVKDRKKELSRDLLAAMLKQLRLSKKDLKR